jgi:ureidoacrylate peracid hydrolase
MTDAGGAETEQSPLASPPNLYAPAAPRRAGSIWLDRPALLVIDMQNGFCRAAGSLACMGAPTERLAEAIGPCVEILQAARSAEIPIVFTRFVYRPDHSDGGILVNELRPHLKQGGALRAGDWDSDLIAELQPRAGEYVVDKNRYSGFLATNLEQILTDHGIRTLILCGVTTNMCVETTARDASQRDYRVYVVREATGEYDPARHEHALNAIAFGFGWVVSLDEMLSALRVGVMGTG